MTTHYAIVRDMIVTASADGSVPLNSRVVATIGNRDDAVECQELIRKANTRDDLVAALSDLIGQVEQAATFADAENSNSTKAALAAARAALAKIGG